MKTVAIVPARGGSKGIPRKNLSLLAGRPLITHMIAAAREAPSLDRLIVSTEDLEIADVAEAAGAEVLLRPMALAADETSSEAVLIHSLDVLEAQGYLPEVLALLQCTSPLTTPADIDGTVNCLRRPSDCAFTATPFHGFVWRQGENGARGVNHDPSVRPRRQDRSVEWLETGAVYAMRAAGFRQAKHRFFGRVVPHPVPRAHSLEIDEPDDLRLAEVLLGTRRPPGAARIPDRPAVVFDFDGVFTDNRVMVLETGQEGVICDRGDGLGLEALRHRGVPILVLSRESNPVGASRCRKLGLEYIGGIRDKRTKLLEWIGGIGSEAGRVVYVGNDVNDLECMAAVGCAIAVADARPEVKAVAHIVLANPGGHGAVREVADLVLSAQGG